MNDPLLDLKKDWKEAKEREKSEPIDAIRIIELSKAKLKKAINGHLYTIGILTFTLIGLTLFFTYVAPFKETISRIGVVLMIGGLLVRILIELFSISQSSKIDLSKPSTDFGQSSLSFFQFRKRIHGPVMFAILVGYSIGFYLLTPEFSLYLSTTMMVFIHISYLVGAIVVGLFIRHGIKKEMKYLTELMALQNDLAEEETNTESDER
ncbi:MAG: hypothetical protein JXR10_10335 [Cyclobacteriaceae bacterium]